MMTEKNPLQIEGFFLEFSGEEIKDVRHALEIRGYSADGQGMKELLLDVLYGDAGDEKGAVDNLVNRTQDFLRNNPETVAMGMNLAMGLLQKSFTKKK